MKANSISTEEWTSELIGREVMMAGGQGDRGRVVSVDTSTLYAVWPKSPAPRAHRRGELWLVQRQDVLKKLSWHGKTFGELEDFVAQAKREGVERTAELNDNEPGTHVHVNVPLPLATEPEPEREEF